MALDAKQFELYKKVGLENNYTLVNGQFVLPVAEDPPTDPAERADWSPVVVVRAFADYRLRTITYGAEKDYTPPIIPTPKDTGPFVFLGGSVGVPFPTINTNAGLTWTVAAEFTFVENVYSDEESGYVIGSLPVVFQTQRDDQSLGSGSGFPPTVAESGLGPKVGYNSGNLVQLDNPLYVYREPSYLPAVFQSDDLIAGPTVYPPQ